MTPGQGTPTFVSPLGRVGIEICFDSLYTNITRGLVRHGAQIIAMPNFDPPTPQHVLHNLRCAMRPFRAVENRVPFVRSDSNGESQTISKSGRVVVQGPLWKPAVLIHGVTLGSGNGTFFTRWGDWFAYLCVSIAVGCGIIGMRELLQTAKPLESEARLPLWYMSHDVRGFVIYCRKWHA